MRWTRRTYGRRVADIRDDEAWRARQQRRREAWSRWRDQWLPVVAVEVSHELVAVHVDEVTGELVADDD